MAYTEFPLQFKRQFSGAIDKDTYFQTNAEMQAYLTDPVRYAGQIVTCGEFPSKVFILNQARSAWNEVSGGSTSDVTKQYVDDQDTLIWNSIDGLTAQDQVLMNYIDQIGDTINSLPAASIIFSPTSNVASANVQSAIEELDSEKIAVSQKGTTNGVATLDGYGKIPVSQMPSMADDVVEILGMYPGNPTGSTGSIYYNTNAKTLLSYNGSIWVDIGAPAAGKLYLNQSDGISYKWNGTDLIATTSALPYASQSDAESGTSYSKVMSPKRVKQSYDYDILNRQLASLGNKSVSTAISDINTTLSTINEHWRGSYISLTALKTAIPIANPGDEATIDAGVGTQAQKAIWDETDQDWYISSGTPVTVDQSINEGSINAVAGGAVFNALQNTNSAISNKVDKNGTDRLLTQTEAELIEGMSPIEFEITDVINGIIIPESPTKLYRISAATDLTRWSSTNGA